MHLYDTIKDDAARQFCQKQLKMDNSKWDISAVNRIEVYGTDFNDPGDDYCEYRVIDNNNKVIAVKREMGY